MGYVELFVTSNFTFLEGASHPHELVEQAKEHGYQSIGITDRNTLAGIVQAHVAAKKAGIRIIVGCRLDLLDGPSLLAYPTNAESYGRLSYLLTIGNLRAEKGKCQLYREDVFKYSEGLKFVVIPPSKLNGRFDFEADFKTSLAAYKAALGEHCYLAACRHYKGDDSKQLFRLQQLADRYGIPLVAVNDVHYHAAHRRELQDILTCIKEKKTIYNAGYLLHPNAERFMKPAAEMERLFRQYPDAIRRTEEIAEACQFSLDSLKYVYPREITQKGRTPEQELTALAWEGAKVYWGDHLPKKIEDSIRYELALIEELKIAEYFLTVEDICRFARNRAILYQGRGSAANSVVCYCLRITFVDPMKFDLLPERFISTARDEPPDIDVDFEHERREEVMQYVYSKYGRERAAIVATVTHLHAKGAVRDVGKAMGLSVDAVDRMSNRIWELPEKWFSRDFVPETKLNVRQAHLHKVLQLTGQLIGFPRQLGQHTGGFVITDGRLSELVPIINARMENRTNIEWDKNDIDAMGFMKIDVLSLGMLTCIRKGFDLLKEHYGRELTLGTVPQDDPAVYEMVSAADTIGVFQIESRAQQAMLPRLRPKCFYDLVIEVAIVRPGPIQGDMVHPYIRRRNGLEKVEYPSKEVEDILGRTLGVPLFQEQCMKIAIKAAGFTPAEADELRRSMATFKAKGLVTKFQEKLVKGMCANGFTEDYAMRIFKQLEGFGSYGFPESHAASFAKLVYDSAWIKCHYPDVFACAILNSLPMGFYQPAQLVSDARRHGVQVLPVDINLSQYDYTLEAKQGRYHALRMGFRQISGIRDEDMLRLIANRLTPYASIHELHDVGIGIATLEKLADADAFGSIGLPRRKALWEISALGDRPIGLFAALPSESEFENVQLPKMSDSENVVYDYATTALSLRAHPVSFLRPKLLGLKSVAAEILPSLLTGRFVRVAGLVLSRQRPGTAHGTCFITLEDETGTINLIVWASVFMEFREAILNSRLLMVEGHLQIEREVIHVIVKRCHNMAWLLSDLTPSKRQDLPVLTLSRADETSGAPFPKAVDDKPSRDFSPGKAIPKARDFK